MCSASGGRPPAPFVSAVSVSKAERRYPAMSGAPSWPSQTCFCRRPSRTPGRPEAPRRRLRATAISEWAGPQPAVRLWRSSSDPPCSLESMRRARGIQQTVYGRRFRRCLLSWTAPLGTAHSPGRCGLADGFMKILTHDS